ncbi:hypothetical protein AQUCO_01800242v1 [Aquilegia coerulea]|uniref:Uncharacterized protein n=1 Tax=Aquilegia coerulea TaxID=218851 RepID=A0A2G5DLC5_AQUCA|nr:hypothetical protein AQUCO_01800242v1 [Aquilegia coerulea]PIA44057.1 hypothetical protein AQUCO_01800242v1 [Aquilegia coerulea]
MVKDAYKGEVFNMCVSLQLTVDDFLAYGNGNKTGSKTGVGVNNVTKSFKMRQLHFDDGSDNDLENEGTFCFSQ